MLIVVNYTVPEAVKKRLRDFGRLVEFRTDNITTPQVAHHPFIFFCQFGNCLIAAPNIPSTYLAQLNEEGINYIKGENPVGKDYPENARYNALVSKKYLVHRIDITDDAIKNNTSSQIKIEVSQGYSRHNILALNDDLFITSDHGIYKTIMNNVPKVIFVNPEGIIRPDHPFGNIGGVGGVHHQRLFLMGTLDTLADGPHVRQLIHSIGYEIIELYDGPLYDGGGILFLE